MACLRFTICVVVVAVATAGTCPLAEPQGHALALVQTRVHKLRRDTIDKAAPTKDEVHAQKASNSSGIKVSATSANVSHKAHHSQKTTEPDPKTSGLPEVTTVLSNSHRVFTEMTSQMTALEARVAEVQQQGALAVSKQKAQYEAKLKAQRADAHAVELTSAGIATENAKLETSNAYLRSKAAKLTQASNTLRATIHDLQGNILTAAEFIDETLDASTMLEKSSELSVLTELSEQDEARNKASAHQNRLSSIGQVSMLQQLGAEKLQPNDMLQSLLSSFDDLAKEQNMSETILKEAFEKQYQDGIDRRSALLAEQAKLSITRDELASLDVKLNVAVTRLETIHRQLLQRSRSIQLFMQQRFVDHSVPAATHSKEDGVAH